jgi:hypothetical protein
MAYYKHGQFLTKDEGPEFDAIHKPGVATPFSGIYRCEVCGKSATSVYSHPLPAQNHHQHTSGQDHIRWSLVVKAHWK